MNLKTAIAINATIGAAGAAFAIFCNHKLKQIHDPAAASATRERLMEKHRETMKSFQKED